MKKYFLTSDTHSYYTPFKKRLDKAGFDINNEEHVLVILGDLFDRGPETIEIYNFIVSLPKERVVLVRGNHEDLFMELTRKDFPQMHDFHNGTVKTFCDIAKCEFDWDNWDDIVNEVLASGVYKLIADESRWVNYFEFGKYVCVHSFVPTNVANWREADKASWGEARWGCPYTQFDEGLFNEPGKTLVCGHWHCSDFHKHYEGKGPYEDFTPYVSDGLIAIDACTAYSGETNVIVIEGE